MTPTFTLFEDRSQFNPLFNNSYPYHFAMFRCNDGNLLDSNFHQNLAWAKHDVDRGALVGFGIYYVWESNWQETIDLLVAEVGTPHPKSVYMGDIERWNGRYNSDCSRGINAAREQVITRLTKGNRKRAIGYGNGGDLNVMWRFRGDAGIVLANYSNNPDFPNKIAHQFADHHDGVNIDINSADGMTPQQFAVKLGIASAPVIVPPKPRPRPIPQPQKLLTPGNMGATRITGHDMYFVRFPNAPRCPTAVYAWNGSYLTWMTSTDYAALGRPMIADLDHTKSTIWHSQIMPGTTDPRR